MSTLAEYITRVERMAKPEFSEELMGVLGSEVVRQIGFGFQTRSDVYGNYWKPRETEKPWPLLEKTGRMRASFRITSVSPEHVTVSSDCEYASFHQYGTKRLPVRGMIPFSNRGFGVWTQRLQYLAQQHVMGALRG